MTDKRLKALLKLLSASAAVFGERTKEKVLLLILHHEVEHFLLRIRLQQMFGGDKIQTQIIRSITERAPKG